jgi:Tfp pilus assembly protein PilO
LNTIHKEKILKNKKIFITILISTALVIIIGGWLFLSSNKKTYNSFTDLFKTMDVSTQNRKANIAALEKFSNKKTTLFKKLKTKIFLKF